MSEVMSQVDQPAAPVAQPQDPVTGTAIYQSYLRSPYLSIKHSSYFHVYDELFEKYRGKEFTFVEVGVLNGGSLFMWRDYFGDRARIIGVDLNPLAQKWTKDGFEIYIGSQSDPEFWESFFKQVGPVDVLLDDGGHTFEQQIVTVHHALPHIRDGGVIAVEDVHTSYFRDFGAPSRYSFISWAKSIADDIGSRFPELPLARRPYKDAISSVRFFESIVSFHVDRRKCFRSTVTSNEGKSFEAEDYRHKGSFAGAFGRTAQKYPFLLSIPGLVALKRWLVRIYLKAGMSGKLRQYF